MSLIVETGSADATAEAYASVAFCDTYHSNMGNAAWAALSEAEKEQALRRATSFMLQRYRPQWRGYRVNETQALDWPRYNVTIYDLPGANLVASDIVPDLVQKANAEYALLASVGDLNPVQTQAVISKTVGPIKIAYDPGSSVAPKYPAIDAMLKPLINGISGGFNLSLRRT